ncbi:MAG: type III-B CRISPR-associated protein Cas10/Cmr2, partial [Gemmataceae bacterium]
MSPDSDKALLSFFLGPVQPFIAGAKTTRDLWSGSFLLAWLTFAAIKKVREFSGAKLVSPYLPDDAPLLWTLTRTGAPPAGITTPCLPNRFIVQIPATANAHKVAKECEQACHAEWAEICKQVRKRIDDKITAE